MPDGKDLEPTAPRAATGGEASYSQRVPAVDQATRILFTLAQSPEGLASLTELCRQVGISKSKGLALLNTLQHGGLVTRNERSKTYSLGPGLLELSRALLDHTDVAHEAGPYLERLAASTGCTALLGLVSSQGLFVVARREPPAGMGIAVQIGHRDPLYWGSHGKAILAALPEEEQEMLLADPSVPIVASHADAARMSALRSELAESRRSGYAQDLGETRPGLNVLSAAIVARPGASTGRARPAGCLIAVGSFPVERAAEVGERVAAMARELALQLGPLL